MVHSRESYWHGYELAFIILYFDQWELVSPLHTSHLCMNRVFDILFIQINWFSSVGSDPTVLLAQSHAIATVFGVTFFLHLTVDLASISSSHHRWHNPGRLLLLCVRITAISDPQIKDVSRKIQDRARCYVSVVLTPTTAKSCTLLVKHHILW
jgi:hypothetical protein